MTLPEQHVPVIRRILVPLDGSPLAEQAIPTAAHIARKSGASILLLQMVQPSSVEPLYAPQSFELIEQLRKAALDSAQCYLERVITYEHLDQLHVKIEVAIGGAAQGIVSIAQQQADLIVMTSHGVTGFRRWLFGSVAQQLLRHSSVPTLILRGEGLTFQAAQSPWMHSPRILITLDGSSFAESILLPAAQLCSVLAAPEKGALHLNQVVEYYQSDRDEDRALTHQLNQENATQAHIYLDQVRQRFLTGDLAHFGLSLTTSVTHYTNAKEIAQRIAEESNCIGDVEGYTGCDIIAMSTHGRHGFQHIVMGSITERVFDAIVQPFLVVHPTLMDQAQTWLQSAVVAQE